MLKNRFGKEIDTNKILPRNKIDAPSHHDHIPDHKDHHKPVGSILKNMEKRNDAKNVEILSPSYQGRK